MVVLLAGAAVAFLLTSGDDEVNLTQAELQSALLTAEDVGPGFTGDTESEEDDAEYEASPACEDLIAEFERTEDEGDNAEIELTRTDPELLITHSLEPLEEGDPGIDDVRSALESCDEITVTDDDGDGTLAFAPEEIGDLGDEATAAAIDVTLTDEDESITLDGYIIFFVRDGFGGSITALAGVDDQDSPLPVDVDFVRQTATKADEKLQRVIDEN